MLVVVVLCVGVRAVLANVFRRALLGVPQLGGNLLQVPDGRRRRYLHPLPMRHLLLSGTSTFRSDLVTM